MLFAIRALAVIRCGVFLFLWECDASTTLENKFVLTDFGDQMFSASAVTNAALVVCVNTTLAIDEWREVGAILARVALLNMAGAKGI